MPEEMPREFNNLPGIHCSRLSFIPTGYVKIIGARFAGLPSNNPLGHYFDALYRTGYYYTFIGIG